MQGNDDMGKAHMRPAQKINANKQGLTTLQQPFHSLDETQEMGFPEVEVSPDTLKGWKKDNR